MKLAILGAGSSYTPELVEELALRKTRIHVDELALYDIDEERLSVMELFLKRYSEKLDLDFKISSYLSPEPAIEGADFIDTQIRVGGNKQRVMDEKIPLRYGLIGQETTGAGGMMKAFRTIPVLLDLAVKVEKYAPNAWIINYTNPTGLITEAITKYTNAKIAGFCSGGIFPKMWAKEALGVSYDQLQYDYVGLNHLNFMSNITIDGVPVTEEEFCKIAQENTDIDLNLVKLLGVIPSPYLQYYYHTDLRIQKLKNRKLTRGEYVQSLEKEIYKSFAELNNYDKPAALAKRGGGGYSEVAINFVESVHNNIDREMVVNVPNRGAITFLPDDAVVEIPCLVNKTGLKPLKVENIPPMVWGLISAVKNYEQLAVEAAVVGSRTKMKWAMLAHPLVRQFEYIDELADELLEANREYLPQFFND